MSDDYDDGTITCTTSGVRIKNYYFPFGAKTIPYSSIKSLQRLDLSLARGRMRIWGTANPGYWANLDPGRTKKKVGFEIDLGKSVKPFVTPSDPDAFERAVRAGANLEPGGPATGAPFI